MSTKVLPFAAAALLLGSSSMLLAEDRARSDSQPPGHEMQTRGAVRGQPGASGYSPGHEMQEKGSKPGEPGASGYAPGQQDTTGQGAGARSGTGSRSNPR